MPGDIHLHLIRKRMAQLVIKQHCISVASGVEKGKVRFNLLNGFIAQKLFFYRGLERKPVSLFWMESNRPRSLRERVFPPGLYGKIEIPTLATPMPFYHNRTCLLRYADELWMEP